VAAVIFDTVRCIEGQGPCQQAISSKALFPKGDAGSGRRWTNAVCKQRRATSAELQPSADRAE